MIPDDEELLDAHSRHLRGRFLFDKGMTHAALTEWFTDEAIVKKTKLSEEFALEELKIWYAGKVLPLFLISEDGNLQIFTTEGNIKPQAGQILISLVLSQPNITEPAEQASPEKAGDKITA